MSEFRTVPRRVSSRLTFDRILFVANTLLAAYSAIPTKAQRAAKDASLVKGDEDRQPSMAVGEDGVWEMYPLPKNTIAAAKAHGSAMVMTPRTRAFNVLSGNRE